MVQLNGSEEMTNINELIQPEVVDKHEKLINDRIFLRKLSQMKVLIVDDHKNMIKTIENMLSYICAFKLKGQSIYRAEDGEEALKILLNQPEKLPHKIDLVLLDWNMPKLPGIEVIRGIRTSEFSFVRDIPVIMITGEAHRDDVTEAVYAGVDNYLLKPFVMEDMRTRMNPLIRRYWSKLKMTRATNRRNETRYPGAMLKMSVELDLGGGETKIADVINLSSRGLRVELDRPGSFDAKHFRFMALGASKEYKNGCDCVSFLPVLEGEPRRIQLSIFIKDGFKSQETESQWLDWCASAKEKYFSYRGQQI
jgi:two-component system chemotaxis response regulator CheY